MIAAGEGDVWIVEEGGIAEIDTARNVVSRRVELTAEFISALAVGAGSVWVADPFDGSLWRIARDPPVAKRRIPLETWVNGVAFGGGAVWATNEIADEVYRIDPRRTRRASWRGPRRRAASAPAKARRGSSRRAPPSRDAALPSPVCGEVFRAGTDAPRFLIVSDLPLQGESRPFTQAIVDGMRHVLEQRGLRGGRAHRRLPVVRRVDRAVRWLRLLPLRLEREGVRAEPQRGRRRRVVPVALLVPSDPRDQRGGRGAARDAQPVEHAPGADGERGALSVGRAELRPDRGSRPPPGDRARPAREVARRAAGGRPLGAR